MAMKKCPNGMYAEIKYDGERVQVHKQGNKFEYFSRSLKAVQPHKVSCACIRKNIEYRLAYMKFKQTNKFQFLNGRNFASNRNVIRLGLCTFTLR